MKQYLEVNGRTLPIETAGPEDGPVVVFLHHGLGAIRSWKGQITEFSSAGFQVLAYDRWGHGESASRTEWSIPNFEQDLTDLEAILGELGHRQASLVGHSDGGNIAMHYAVNHPEQVTCLVIVAAHIYIETKMNSGIQLIKHQFEGDHRFRNQMRRVHADNSEPLFWGWFNSWSDPSILDWDMRPEISQISCPTLVVQGLEDEHSSPQHARDLAASIPESDLWLVPGASHMLPQENPEEFNLRVLHFCQTLAVQTQP
jgi:pimeloyl-ACP methyl ester carboxylesterase